MAKKPETRFKEKIQKLLKPLYPHIWVFKVEAGAIRGIPDMIFCAGGVFVSWELKTEDGTAEPLQMYRVEQICKAKGVALIVRPSNLEWALEQLQRIAGLHPKTIHELEFQNVANQRFISSGKEPTYKDRLIDSTKRSKKSRRS